MQTVWFMLNTCFPVRSLEFWYALRSGCLREQPPVKTWGTETLMEFPRQKYHTHNAAFHWWGKVNILWPHMRGRDCKEAWIRIPPDSACLFPLWLDGYSYYITEIHLSDEYSYMLSPVSASNVSLNMGALGMPDTCSIPASNFAVTSHLRCHQMQSSFHPYHAIERVFTTHFSTKQHYPSCKSRGTIDMSWMSVWSVPEWLPHLLNHVLTCMTQNMSQEVSSENWRPSLNISPTT